MLPYDTLSIVPRYDCDVPLPRYAWEETMSLSPRAQPSLVFNKGLAHSRVPQHQQKHSVFPRTLLGKIRMPHQEHWVGGPPVYLSGREPPFMEPIA